MNKTRSVLKSLLLTFPVLVVLVGCDHSVKPNQTITVAANDTAARKMMIAPLGIESEAMSMELTDGSYSATLATSSTGFYNLISIKEYSQSIIPHYVNPTKSGLTSQLEFGEGGSVNLKGSDDNEALAAYVSVYAELSRSLWSGAVDLTSPDVLKGFITKADSISEVYRCSTPVREYLKVWGYLNAYDNYSSVQRLLGVKPEAMPYSLEEVVPEPHTVLDIPIAALFANTPHVVYAAIPNKNNLDSALIYVAENYTDTALIKKVNNNIASRYVSRFNYNEGFDKGLERLQLATERYGLDPQHVEAFAKHRATVPGQPFPDNVVLRDKHGNVVDFASFRGKYVYIDLWASWCVPCLREVPVLQELEKSLKNDKVTFLSISIDASEDAWKDKMTEKNMHGHQLWNPENTLGKALNVKGIPFFAIYDPEGKLYMHGAPRPSQGPGLVELLERLK